nr:PRD domain-containing protein [uncultured Tyzzerella sp.]
MTGFYFDGGINAMVFKKRLNNNVIIAQDENGNEKILMGCGLGFKLQEKDIIDESKIEKVFSLTDPKMNRLLQELAVNTPIEFIDFATDIVTYAKNQIDNRINENVVISICDHVYMAVERFKKGIEVKNVMLWDIKKFYKSEFEVGLYALDIINKKFGVQLSEDEAGFIALHIVNSQLDLHKKSVKEITELMQEIEKIVTITFGTNLDATSVYYYRFITHLKFFAERLFNEKTHINQDIDGLLDIVKDKYVDSYKCVLKISSFILKNITII